MTKYEYKFDYKEFLTILIVFLPFALGALLVIDLVGRQ